LSAEISVEFLEATMGILSLSIKSHVLVICLGGRPAGVRRAGRLVLDYACLLIISSLVSSV